MVRNSQVLRSKKMPYRKALRNQGFSHFLPLYFIVNFYRCQRPTRWIRTIEIDNRGRISDFHSPILPFFRIQKY